MGPLTLGEAQLDLLDSLLTLGPCGVPELCDDTGRGAFEVRRVLRVLLWRQLVAECEGLWVCSELGRCAMERRKR